MVLGSKPMPEVVFAWGSESTMSVLYSNTPRQAPKLIVVVVFPTPPF